MTITHPDATAPALPGTDLAGLDHHVADVPYPTAASYAEGMRTAATRAGKPLNRSVCPGLTNFAPDDDEVVRVVTSSGRRAAVTTFTYGSDVYARQDLTPGAVRSLVYGAYGLPLPGKPGVQGESATPLVFADRRAWEACLAMARAGAKNDRTLWSLVRIMEYRVGLPDSVHLPFLTDALAIRYWMPSTISGHEPADSEQQGLSPLSLEDWLAAFALSTEGPGARLRAIRDLIYLAAQGTAPIGVPDQRGIFESQGARESTFANAQGRHMAFRWAGATSSQMETFRYADTGHNLTRLLRSLDMEDLAQASDGGCLAAFHALAGAVTRIEFLGFGEPRHGLPVRAQDASLAKESGTVWIFGGSETGRILYTGVKAIEYTGEDFRIRLTCPGKRGPKDAKSDDDKVYAERLHRSQASAWMVTAPYDRKPSISVGQRWLAPNPNQPAPAQASETKARARDIPAFIALAGAPEA